MKKILRATFLGITALVASVFAFPQNVEAESKTASIKASVEETLSLTLSANAMNFNLEHQNYIRISSTLLAALTLPVVTQSPSMPIMITMTLKIPIQQ